MQLLMMFRGAALAVTAAVTLLLYMVFPLRKLQAAGVLLTGSSHAHISPSSRRPHLVTLHNNTHGQLGVVAANRTMPTGLDWQFLNCITRCGHTVHNDHPRPCVVANAT